MSGVSTQATPPTTVDRLPPREAIQATLARLCSRPDERLPDTWLQSIVAADEADALARTADRTLIGGLLWSALTRSQRELLPEEARRRLQDRHLGNALRWQTTRKLLVEAGLTLGKAGIPMAPLKGGALLLMMVYSDPGQREMVDLDLLVAEEAIDTAQHLLSRGAEIVKQRSAEHRHHGPIYMPGAGGMLELHGLAPHEAFWPHSGDIFETGSCITIEGASFTLPDEVNMWLHVAAHGIYHMPNYWPRMAADLSRLQALPQWNLRRWEAVWQAAQAQNRTRTVLVAAAIAGSGRIPGGLLEAAGAAVDRAAIEARAREAWGIATTIASAKFGPWSTSWVTHNEQRRMLLSEHLFPPPVRLSERMPVPRSLAYLLYPCSVTFRCFELVKMGLAWRGALRGRSFPETPLGS